MNGQESQATGSRSATTTSERASEREDFGDGERSSARSRRGSRADREETRLISPFSTLARELEPTEGRIKEEGARRTGDRALRERAPELVARTPDTYSISAARGVTCATMARRED